MKVLRHMMSQGKMKKATSLTRVKRLQRGDIGRGTECQVGLVTDGLWCDPFPLLGDEIWRL